MLHDEVELVIEQENNRMASEAMLLQGAAASVLSEEGGKHFQEIIEKLSE